ncbi:uncharacterized protein M6B38_105195 [Iris pallida]|uniref:BAR domain-containing protein n=1 Tax=Iris pallida TaxID=29817 RepID=A0AAX6F476_IRIPA|nr:uncharacterized protein M6B38_105195 [Iris pallida]
MKSPLRKFRGFVHSKSEAKEKKDIRRQRPTAKLDELVQASQDMLDMRSCYDSLLSAAAATANSAYEFSEALEEMGTCLLEKTALNDDEDSGRVLLMLGKIQFELQNLVGSYRAHVIQTITTPSESLLKELQTVEEMKRQCDDKRDLYKFMLAAQREKGKSKHAKGETFSSQQLLEAQNEYEEEANLFVFRLKSLKQGQSRSLLTQAARHHAAQLSFFRKGLKSLESVEPHVKVVADREHIDYQFSGLEDDDTEDDDSYGFDANEDGELSFDYGENDHLQDALSPSRKSMELDQVDQPVPRASPPRASVLEPAKEDVSKGHTELLEHRRASVVSQSAPLFPHKKFDPAELRPSSTRKLYTYALPTPVDAMRSISHGSVFPGSTARLERKVGLPTQLWHSSPLDPEKLVKNSKHDNQSSPTRKTKAQSTVLKESSINSMRPPLGEGQSPPHRHPLTGSESKKIKLQASSGPLTSRHWSTRPSLSATDYRHSVEFPPALSAMPAHVLTSHISVSPKASPNTSPPPISSPKISELHELPRPPISSARPTRPTSLIGHSAPLVYRGPELQKMKVSSITPQTASPLPTPPAAVHRSFSIPSRSGRMPMSPLAKFLETSRNSYMTEDVASPPLTPITLTNTRTTSPASESVTHSAKARGLS